MFQISKQRMGKRLVYALLLEASEGGEGFRRVGVVELACYNSNGIPKRASGERAASKFYSHPVLVHSAGDDVRKDYETTEWQVDRWSKGSFKLF